MERLYNVAVPMRDDTTLATDVYLPEKRPVRTILGRTPYNKNGAAFAQLAERWNARGYALVVQDVRGRGDSDGIFTPYLNEGPDGHDAVEWCAAQPWSDGAVIISGASYGARSGWLTALARPPHLRGFVATVAPSDPFVEFPNGQSPMMVSWYCLVQGRMVQHADAIDWLRVYEHLPLATMDEAAGFRSDAWKASLEYPPSEERGEGMRYQHRFAELDLPVLHVSGWYDDEQIGTPLNYRGMVAQAATENARRMQRLLMGPWGHAVNTTRRLGEVDFGPDALIDLEGYTAGWIDWILGGTEQAPSAPVRIFVMGANRWRDEQEWPLARTAFTDFYLHSNGDANSRFGDGRLDRVAPVAAEPPDSYVYDPRRPVPFITEPRSSQLGGPDDCSAVEQRGDVLCYTTDALDEPAEMTGPVSMRLFASSSCVDTDFTAKLVDVHPTGFCQRLCDTVVRARYREGHDRGPVPMTPSTVYTFEVDLWNTSHVFGAGHRIRLEISSSAFPKYDRNLNTGEPIDTGTRMGQATNSVWHDPDHPSCLVLPAIPRDAVTP